MHRVTRKQIGWAAVLVLVGGLLVWQLASASGLLPASTPQPPDLFR